MFFAVIKPVPAGRWARGDEPVLSAASLYVSCSGKYLHSIRLLGPAGRASLHRLLFPALTLPPNQKMFVNVNVVSIENWLGSSGSFQVAASRWQHL